MIDLIFALRKSMLALISFSLIATLSGCNVNSSITGPGSVLNIAEPVPVALLIPQSVKETQHIALSIENAARLAIADLGNIRVDLRVYDTAGSAVVAGQVAQQAVNQGAKIILGPLFAEAANAAGLAVADEGINVLSFSNNASIAGGNVFVLGQTFDNTANRLVQFAAAQGKRKAIIVHPNNVEGEFGRIALEKAADQSSLKIVASQAFEFSREGVVNTVPLVRAAVEIEDADLLFLTSTTAGALGLLIQMLPEAGINSETMQYAGLARWDIPPQNLELSGIQGGWFTIPDREMLAKFSARYEASYQRKPHHLASLSYDGIAAIGALVFSEGQNALSKSSLTQQAGFEGVDGIFRFKSNGTNERGLAIARIENKQVKIIDPAPASFGRAGF
ncbi:MAG: penicillin-binding protein activator [Aestuariivita sp.]|nr:penicillin-binding protein activator [Aestuariivita sp.]